MTNLSPGMPPYILHEKQQSFRQGQRLDGAFEPVHPEELGFALTLFVAAGNKRLSPHCRPDLGSLDECVQLFLGMSADRETAPRRDAARFARKASLQVAFLALWQHYRDHGLQRSLCARVLGFYLLMERTGGEALQDWMDLCPNQPEAVALHPAVVDALAVVPLDRAGNLDQMLLLKTIELMSTHDALD